MALLAVPDIATSAIERRATALHGKPLVDPDLPAQTRVYYNARIALRERRYQDVLKLWLLRNALESNGVEPLHDGDFRSAVWAALAGAGLCHDGIPADDDDEGVGLWPLALHNWLTRTSSRQPPPGQPRSFTSFETGFQQRLFSLYDVLSDEELKGARFTRGRCFRPYFALAFLGSPHWLNLDDRLSVGITMRDLLEKARETLKHERVRGQVVIDTRLFDLEVALVKLAKSAARRETGLLAQIAKTTGVSEAAMTLVREERLAEVRRSGYADLLRKCVKWSVLDWFSLSRNRRLALFAEASDTLGKEPDVAEDLDRTVLANVDELVARKDGDELVQWLGFASPKSPPLPGPKGELPPDLGRRSDLIAALVLGERGEKLLGLGPDEGFRERSAVALWRGVDYLQRGKALDAMRSFALAMQRSEESRNADDVHNLAKRWFAYVLSQYQADDESLALLNEFVSPIDRNELLEILLWRAAFHADAASFERIASGVRRGGALDFRLRMLEKLAHGDAGAMWSEVRTAYEKSPHGIYKFAKQLTEELATESLDVRLKNRATLQLGMTLLEETGEEAHRGLKRRIDEQLQRMQTLLDSLDLFDESAEGRARAAAPGAEAYAGSVRLAPADPLPWPFGFPLITPPSPFTPIELTPVEWRGEDGELVFGWHIHEK